MNGLFKKIEAQIKSLGWKRVLRILTENLFDNKTDIKPFVVNKIGLEIGGPTRSFFHNKLLSIYPFVKSLDNVNFSTNNIWSSNFKDSSVFHYDNRIGRQFICEASNMEAIKDNLYDFVVSSHVIEHLSNPVKAILEMKRVIKLQGFVILIVPHKEITFDHKRRTTELDHMIEDFKKNVPEGVTSHLDFDEIIENYDYSLDSGISNREDFLQRTKDNISNRALHQHVFITETVLNLLDYCNLKIILVKPRLSYGIMVVSQKLPEDDQNTIKKNNIEFLSINSPWRLRSPFKLDKRL